MKPRRSTLALLPIALLVAGCGDDPRGDGTCEPDDLDGVVGGTAAFVLSVTDSAFKPAILTAQNQAVVTLTLTNAGTTPHGFVIDCLPTPNDDDCPQESCFPDEAAIAPLPPGDSLEIQFETPNPEGIYRFRSSRQADEPAGQFVIR